MYNIRLAPTRFLLAVRTKPGGSASLLRRHHGSAGCGFDRAENALGLGWYKILVA